MARDAWTLGAQKIAQLMRKDIINLYESVPQRNSIGELSDSLTLIGTYKANVTTPAESIDEEVQGTLRPHYYQITLGPEVSVPTNSKIFIELVEVRQGIAGTMVEIKDLEGGLLGQTLTGTDEAN